MLARICLALALSLTALTAGLPAMAADCTLLPEAQLRGLLPDLFKNASGPLQQTSDGVLRCRYLWPKADREAREAQNQELMRRMLQRGHEAPQLLPLWNEIVIDLISQADSEAAAKQNYADVLAQRFAPHYGSPDPLAGLQLEPLAATDRQQAWSKAKQQLLVQLGNRLLMLGVQLEDDPSKNQTLAQNLGNALK